MQAQNNIAGHKRRGGAEGDKARAIQQAINAEEAQRDASPEQYSKPSTQGRCRARQVQNNTANHERRGDAEGGTPRTIHQARHAWETQRDASPEQSNKP